MLVLKLHNFAVIFRMEFVFFVKMDIIGMKFPKNVKSKFKQSKIVLFKILIKTVCNVNKDFT